MKNKMMAKTKMASQAEALRNYFEVCEKIRELEAIKEELKPAILKMVKGNHGAPIEAGGFRASVSEQTRENVSITKVRANITLYELLQPYINESVSERLTVNPLKAEQEADLKVSNA